MGCGCGKKGNRSEKVSTSKNRKGKTTRQILKELWNKSEQEKKKVTVKKINKKR